jgi:hypothetical protein
MKHLLIALACSAAVGAFAQSTPAPAAAAAFRCGGVGNEDQQRIKGEAAQHDMLLTFATSNGAYLADIDFEISKGGQPVLRGRCDGPLMLVDVGGSGSYEVRASSNGREQRKTVTLGKKPATAVFTWPAS